MNLERSASDSVTTDKIPSDLILRDQLAIDRTILANERTFLAYIRTFLAFLLTGASMIHFLDSLFLNYIGVGFIVLSLLLMVIGIKSFLKFKLKINSIMLK